MGYRGAIRSIGTVVRQMERESIRKQKELIKQQKQYEKMQVLEQAAYEVEVYDNYIERVTTLQKDCGPKYDWENIYKKMPPIRPTNKKINENVLKSKLDNFKPNIIDKLFKLESKKKEKIKNLIPNAIERDDKVYNEEIKKYEPVLKEHNEINELSKNILDGNLEYYKKAVDDISPFEEIDELGSDIEIKYISSKKIRIVLKIHDEKVIPKQSKSLLKSGKLSIKDIPKSKYNELYQDYVCSAIIRIGRELFAILPVDEIIITAKGELLNTSTGRLEEQSLLSVMLVLETMEMINFDLIDPSDSMSNFIHNMSFKKSVGMAPVKELD